jgi:uncharacterized protein (DUF983 family)
MSGDRAPVSALSAAVRCRCPRCGEGRIFRGVLTVVARCPSCDLDLAAEDAGDGPAAFVILILGAVVVFAAVVVEMKFAPPVWVHIVLWPLAVLGGTIVLQRILKAWLIGMQYRHRQLGGERPR